MADKMEFPSTIEEFIKGYSFKDSDEVYTNGAELIPVFRVEQAFEHYEKEIRKKAIDEFAEECKKFGFGEYTLRCIKAIAEQLKGGAE